MKVPTRVRYGVRMMIELALNHGSAQVSLQEISSRLGVSLKYLEQVAADLKKTDLIRAVRGRRGGYMLSRPPTEITLMEVHEALDGSFTPVECVANPAVCDRERSCAAREVWKELADAVDRILGDTTLQGLADRQTRKQAEAGHGMYHI